MTRNSSTQEAILTSARRHFMKHGFKDASLNRIVSDAGFTKGAFYGYYKSKEELFDALVEQTSEELVELLGSITSGWSAYAEADQMQHLDEAFFQQLPRLADFIVSHRDDLRLILTKAQGTRYEGFTDSLVENNIEHIEPMLDRAGLSGVDRDTYRLLMTAYYGVLSQVVTGDYGRERIIRMIHDVQIVFQNGILSLAKQQDTQEKAA